MTKQEEFDSMRDDVAETGYGKSYSELSPQEKYEVDSSLIEASSPGEYTGIQLAPKPRSVSTPKPAAPKPPAEKKSSSSKATSSKKIDNLVESLRSNTEGTIIGTAGNTTYVIEAHKAQSTYVKPNGVRSTGTVTRFNVTPIRKGTNSADVKFFRNSEELKDYMKSKGATWKSRKKKLSDKQKNRFFD